jgi:preprotein translocase subunit SecY
MVVFVVFMETGYRRIPISYAKRVVGGQAFGGHSSHIPLKVNPSGVIPIIFASSVLMLPVTVAQFADNPAIKKVASYLEWGTPLQTALYVLLIIFFTYFYTAVTIKIPDMADNLKKYGAFIPGIRPGQPTAEYLDHVMTRITVRRIALRLHRRGAAELPFGTHAHPGRVLRRHGAAHRGRRRAPDDEAD